MKIKFLLLLFCSVLSLDVSAQKLPKSQWAKFENNRIHYYDIGNRKTDTAIVFVHGWTCNADFWHASYRAFPEYRVIAIDLIGHGRSDKPQANYTMEYFARSVDAVMQKAGAKRAVLVGHSMGTPVIRQFYRLHPERTLGLVIVDGALRPFGPREQVEKFFEPLFTDYRENAPKFIDGLLGPTRADLKPDIKTAMLSTPDHVAVSAMRGMLDDAIWTSDQIKVPVLAILAKSPNWPLNIKDLYGAIAPDMDFQMWDGVSHFLMMEQPVRFNEQVRSFVVRKKLL